MVDFTNNAVAGWIPQFMFEGDLRPAKEQIHERYAHGGGWNEFEGFVLTEWDYDNPNAARLQYPGDPKYRVQSWARLHDTETILLFPSSWVVIVQRDGTYNVARLD